MLTFANQSSKPVDVVWVDFDARERVQSPIPSGRNQVWTSGGLNLWRFKRGGELVGEVFTAKELMQQTVTIRDVDEHMPSDLVKAASFDPEPACRSTCRRAHQKVWNGDYNASRSLCGCTFVDYRVPLTAVPTPKYKFSVFNYNAMLLPGFAFPNHMQEYRAFFIARAFGELRYRDGATAPEGPDVVVFNEAFHDAARKSLLDGMSKQGYTYQTKVVDGPGGDNGGVVIVSRWKIEEEAQLLFSRCAALPGETSDCLSRKGAMYVRINKQGRLFHVFGTHTQSSRGGANTEARNSQLKELIEFAKRKAPDAAAMGEPVIFSGDMNIDFYQDTEEYDSMLKTLNAKFYGINAAGDLPKNYTPSIDGKIDKVYTFQTKVNTLARYRYPTAEPEWLDYVLPSEQGKMPYGPASYEVVRFTTVPYHVRAAGDPFGWFANGTFHTDLSDHYGLLAEFTFEQMSH